MKLVIRNPTIFNIIRWVAGTNDSSTKHLMFQVYIIFFIISCKILCKNHLNLFSYFFYNLTKIKIKIFECPKSMKNIKNLEHQTLSFVPLSKQPSVIYCRLADFWVRETVRHKAMG